VSELKRAVASQKSLHGLQEDQIAALRDDADAKLEQIKSLRGEIAELSRSLLEEQSAVALMTKERQLMTEILECEVNRRRAERMYSQLQVMEQEVGERQVRKMKNDALRTTDDGAG
jgi:hypothetical protein